MIITYVCIYLYENWRKKHELLSSMIFFFLCEQIICYKKKKSQISIADLLYAFLLLLFQQKETIHWNQKSLMKISKVLDRDQDLI